MIRFYFNPKSAEAFAKELRRASWGAALIAGTVVFKEDSGTAMFAAVLSWISIQALAIVIEPVKVVDRSEK